jgi:hypothetical protein
MQLNQSEKVCVDGARMEDGEFPIASLFCIYRNRNNLSMVGAI